MAHGGTGPSGRPHAEAGAHLREALELAAQTSDRLRLIDCLDICGHLCAATGRWAEAITLWAAYIAQSAQSACPTCRKTRSAARNPCGRPRKRWDPPGHGRRRTRRGDDAWKPPPSSPPCSPPRTRRSRTAAGLAQLSAREQELVTLVAQGRTDAQIAGQLYISVRTVRSHLDRIRDKSGCGAAPT